MTAAPGEDVLVLKCNPSVFDLDAEFFWNSGLELNCHKPQACFCKSKSVEVQGLLFLTSIGSLEKIRKHYSVFSVQLQASWGGMRGIALRWIGLILAALTYVMMLITPGKGYTIGDAGAATAYAKPLIVPGGVTEYLRIFTKKYHQVWTQILSQGGYREPNFEALMNYKPNDGTESVFIQGVSPKPRHFHSAQFFNGSMYIFGGLDKDMYYNDMYASRHHPVSP